MTHRMVRVSGLVGMVAVTLALASCGGGGGNGDSFTGGNGGGGGGGGGLGSTYTPGVYQPSSNYAGRCTAPRSGTNPGTGRPYPDVTGSVTDQNNWLRSWTNELYLWYREVPDLNPGQYNDSLAYFDLLKTSEKFNGADKDKFHFTYPTTQWQSISTSGQDVTYGINFALVATMPPRKAVVAYVEPAAPAATLNQSITRGIEILTVDGVNLVTDTTQAGVDKINAGLFPSTAGETHTFLIKELNGVQRTVTLQAAVVTSTPVTAQVLTETDGAVGYLLFNDHIATAESQLLNAINTFKQAGVRDVILDIRYNGGGYLDIASELAYMLAGPTMTAGQTFERLQFNDKYPNTDPVAGGALTPTPFYTRSQGIDKSLAANTVLPTLNLQRVFVLTTGSTCSASESIINGLRGVNIPVIQIGTTTCGKPYGFYPTDNCGTTYFSIQFRGVNAKSYGDYTNGFVPALTENLADQSQVKGCTVGDDFTQPLGSRDENQLQTALGYRISGVCTANVSASSLSSVSGAMVVKPVWQTNRIIRH